MKEGNCIGWDLCLYGFLPKGTLQSTQHRDIGNWNIKNLGFTGIMVKVQGSRMPEHVENMRIISERRELQKKGPQNLSKVPFNFMAALCSWMRGFKKFSKEQQLEDKTAIKTTNRKGFSCFSLQEREFGLVSSQDYLFLKQKLTFLKRR